MQNPWLCYGDSRSRSHLKVMGLILNFVSASSTTGKIWSNVYLNKMLYRTSDSATQAQGQGHIHSEAGAYSQLFRLLSKLLFKL